MTRQANGLCASSPRKAHYTHACDTSTPLWLVGCAAKRVPISLLRPRPHHDMARSVSPAFRSPIPATWQLIDRNGVGGWWLAAPSLPLPLPLHLPQLLSPSPLNRTSPIKRNVSCFTSRSSQARGLMGQRLPFDETNLVPLRDT